MDKALAEISGFAPVGLIDRLQTARWRRINDGEGGKLFTGITLAGRHLVKNGGSEDAPFLVVVTDESTGNRFEIRGRSFQNIPEEVRTGGIFGPDSTRILKYSLKEQRRDGFVKYTLHMFPSYWVD